jgi:mitochondrial inner membrane protease subunit 2
LQIKQLWKQLRRNVREARIWAPFRAISRQIHRIPAPYRRFIGNVLKFLPIISVAIIHFPYQVMHTNGSSMSPFLNPNNTPDLPETKDKLLIKKIGLESVGFFRTKYRPDGGIRRGEIVVFTTPHDPTKIAVKRVIGLPGDIVTPLPGFDGPSEVVVQYNHIWVEGDVDDREKSRDSNWYGQISQNLVIGRVVAVLEPWYSPRWLNIDEHNYPAKRKGRVAIDAVAEAKLNLDQQAARSAWIAGNQIPVFLAHLRGETSQRRLVNMLMREQKARAKAARNYGDALDEAMRNDPNTRALAVEVVEAFAAVFEKAGLDVVLDEHQRLDLQPNQEAWARMKERGKQSRFVEEEPEEQLKRRKQTFELRMAKVEKELEEYDQWNWWNRYKPKAVLAGKLEKRKAEFEREVKKLERKNASTRELENLQAGHLGGATGRGSRTEAVGDE